MWSDRVSFGEENKSLKVTQSQVFKTTLSFCKMHTWVLILRLYITRCAALHFTMYHACKAM